jgi:single-stranded DNA-binding protein
MITGTLSGRLTADPAVRQGQNGNFTTFSVASNYGKGKDQVDFVDCTANGKTGELVAEHFRKGNVFVGPAEFRTREYTTNDGQKRQALSATVSMIDWTASQTDPKNQAAAAPAPQPAQYNQPAYPAAGAAPSGYGAPPAPGGYGAPPALAAAPVPVQPPQYQNDPFGYTYQLMTNGQWMPVRPSAPAASPAPTAPYGAPPAPGYGAGAPPAGQGPATPF